MLWYIVALHAFGDAMIALISLIGARFLLYFWSFFIHWPRYRLREKRSTEQLRCIFDLPHLKIQVTTRGSEGSTPVIRRGIDYVQMLAREDPALYKQYFSVEIITENAAQANELTRAFAACPVPVSVVVLPKEYQTPNGTLLKARGLHYMVELRRQGYNHRPGQTFIVHYDEESVMTPAELRNLWYHLAHTDKKLMEGPIYYPFEYVEAPVICRAMEANRPIGCFECRHVMERGVPLHLHGSNLVVDEQLENELGWDIGNLDGQAFIAEDYVFGLNAFLHYGSSIFGWHGCVMLEQPPFSFKSAFRQRYRWIIGVLQGIEMAQRLPSFSQLPRQLRRKLIWGTRYRIATFAAGLPAGALSFLYLLYQLSGFLLGWPIPALPWPLALWLIFVGFLWLNSIVIGASYNIASVCQMKRLEFLTELSKVLTVAPIAGVLESSAAFWAVVKWSSGERAVVWTPTPKTREADAKAIAQKEEVVR